MGIDLHGTLPVEVRLKTRPHRPFCARRFALVNKKPVFYSYVVKARVGFLLILFGLSSSVEASPFLACDPYGPDGLQPTAFEVTVNGRSERVAPLTYPDGSVYLRYDLKDFPDGEHAIKVKALHDVWTIESVEVIRMIQKQDGVFFLISVPKAKEVMAPSKSYRGYIRR